MGATTPCRMSKPIYNDLAVTPLKIHNPFPKVVTSSSSTTTMPAETMSVPVPDTMTKIKKRTYEPSLMDLIKSKSRKLFPAAMHVQFQSCCGRNIKIARSERELAHGWWW